MIQTKADLLLYLQKDKEALGIIRKRPRIVGDVIWKFQIALRKHEFYHNQASVSVGGVFWSLVHYWLGIKLGFSIPINVFDYGLRINHYGYLVVNPGAQIGKFCDIHQGVNIGQNIELGSVPVIGDNVWIGPGAKLFGRITIANGIVIGANAVVNKSFTEENITIAGVPARKVKDSGNPYQRK